MDTKTQKWYGLVKLGESSHELNAEPASLRALFSAAESLVNRESGQFTRTGADVVIRFSLKPHFAAQSDAFSDSRLDAAMTDIYDVREGETPAMFYARLEELGEMPGTIHFFINDRFGIASEEFEILKAWQADTDIRRLIRATANGEEFERMGVPEYRRLQEYALTQYPTMCEDIQWRVAV